MRLLVVGGLLSAVIAATAWGCSDDEEIVAAPSATTGAPATPSPSPAPNLTAEPSPAPSASADFDSFRQFAPAIAAAVRTRDASFFSSRGIEIEIICRGDEQVGQCTGQPAGTMFRGIPVEVSQTDAFGVTPRDEFDSDLSAWFALSAPEIQDSFGGGNAILLALAERQSAGELLAIVSLIGEGPPFSPGTSDRREYFAS
jgi:hypothetical protein